MVILGILEEAKVFLRMGMHVDLIHSIFNYLKKIYARRYVWLDLLMPGRINFIMIKNTQRAYEPSSPTAQ